MRAQLFDQSDPGRDEEEARLPMSTSGGFSTLSRETIRRRRAQKRRIMPITLPGSGIPVRGDDRLAGKLEQEYERKPFTIGTPPDSEAARFPLGVPPLIPLLDVSLLSYSFLP
jgi:hypothetical protein